MFKIAWYKIQMSWKSKLETASSYAYKVLRNAYISLFFAEKYEIWIQFKTTKAEQSSSFKCRIQHDGFVLDHKYKKYRKEYLDFNPYPKKFVTFIIESMIFCKCCSGGETPRADRFRTKFCKVEWNSILDTIIKYLTTNMLPASKFLIHKQCYITSNLSVKWHASLTINYGYLFRCHLRCHSRSHW